MSATSSSTCSRCCGRDDILGRGPYADLDRETVRRAGRGRAPGPDQAGGSFADSDHELPVFDPQTHSVTLSGGVQEVLPGVDGLRGLGLELPAELGGQVTPPSVQWAVNELNIGRQSGGLHLRAGPKFAYVIWANGTERDKRIAQIMIERQWGATMVLTEPDAGSDVGAGRTRAVPQPDGSWHIEGVKRFITSGEHDLTENIVHLVLARPVGARPGHQRAVAVHRAQVPLRPRDRELTGERNGVYATGLEHKMGIRASAPASSPSASTGCQPRAGCSARCTTASPRCSRSSSTPG